MGNVLDSRIDELGKLEELTLEGNNLKQPTQHVWAQGVEKLHEYMDAWKAVSQSATKVEAWLKGAMVRRGFGKYSWMLSAKKGAKEEIRIRKIKKEKREKLRRKRKNKKKFLPVEAELTSSIHVSSISL